MSKQIEEIIDGLEGDFRIGIAYHISTVTDHWIGRVTKVSKSFVYLEQASWIPQLGRMADVVSGKTEPEEVEPVGDIAIKMDVIAAKLEWKNKIPTKQK